MSDLDRLAEAFGIAAGYTDAWGTARTVSDDTKRALLAALDIAADDPEHATRALEARTLERWRRPLPPVHTLAAERAGALDLALPADTDAVAWTLTPERGVPHRGDAIWSALERVERADVDGTARERRRLPIEPLQPGYYTLSVVAGDAVASTLVIAAPECCWLPPRLRLQPGQDAPGRYTRGRVWGIAVQLYGLRSPRNWGIGDFTDLAELARGAAALGVQAIGLSPLHALFPEAPERCSPYAPSSRLFLNLLYLDVERIDGFAECAEARRAVADPAFRQRLAALRAAPLIDHVGVAAVKRPLLEMLFRQFRRSGDRVGFAAFRALQGLALERHAIFEALSEHFAAQPEPPGWWGAWPEDYRDPAAPAVQAFAEQHVERVEFFAWAQWQADRQLAAAHAAARRGGMAIGLYRDLAVGSDSAGAELWLDPKRYARGVTVGAPPDIYNPNGQDWGLPPLRPDRLRDDGFRSFIELLRANMARAGALRIDHAFALMRLFWVPRGMRPDQGAYMAYPFDDLLAVLKLESQRNRCLVVGEDLGTVPPHFREACIAAGVLSYRLLYFERTPDGGFVRPEDYPELALAAASTHDLPTLAGWWAGGDLALRAELGLYPSDELRARDREDRARDRERLRATLQAAGLLESRPGPGADDDAPPIAAAQRYLARSRAALLMVQLEDALGLVEQANLPGTIDQHPNWRRTLPVTVDALLAPDGPLARVAEMVASERPHRPSVPGALQRPGATYRIQLHGGFTFHDAAAMVPYLAQLGITHLYTSPYLKARPGSQHGYDIIDHASMNPELGGEAGFAALVAALERHGMGHVLDFVPNHMGVGGDDNDWWLDVLEWGEASRYADYFDIDWRPRFGSERGRLLLPILGAHYGEVLENGELALACGAGGFSIWYYAHRLPVCPVDYPMILDAVLALAAAESADDQAVVELAGLIGDFRALDRARDGAREDRPADGLKLRLAGLLERSPRLAGALDATLQMINGGRDKGAALHRILEAQSYRIAFWRVAGEINYRRFFDINELAGLRMETRALFDHAHRLVFELIDAGKLHGLRIDHIDGLADPAQYCRRIQDRVGPDLFLVVEKILATHEHLPADWPIDGTTGYEVLNQINGVFIATAAERGLDRVYRRFTGRTESFDELLYRAKTQILENNLSSELRVLALELKRIADVDPHTRDYTFDALRRALVEVIAWFPVYRTYVTAREITAEDRQHIDWAVGRAAKHSQLADPTVYNFVRAVLTVDHRPVARTHDVLEFVRKFQQLTGPVMAKGLEDTSFYRYNRFVSLNEVGGDPRRFGLSVAAFHRLNERRAITPAGMVATATHDTKRGEDVRARLNLLSEMPAAWGSRVTRWSRLNRLRRHQVDDQPAPTRNDEYLIYQTLVGSWPLGLDAEAGPALDAYVERVVAYLVKALREAKERSSWTQPNTPYEEAVGDFVRRILDARRPNLFLTDFLAFHRRIAELGMVNGLAQTVLKLTIPGVPDIYQGTEFWDLSLVDPDNRRPVDYDARRAGLASNEPIEALVARWTDGRIKQRVIATLLQHRRRHRELYETGGYRPLSATGPRAEHVLAFERRGDADALVVVAAVGITRLVNGAALPLGAQAWGDTALGLPAGGRWRELFTGVMIEPAADEPGWALPVADALARLPVACLERVRP